MSENGSERTFRMDWAQVDALADEDIDTSDVPPLIEDFFRRATWRKPSPGDGVPDTLDRQGPLE